MGYRIWVHSLENGELKSKIVEVEDEAAFSTWLEANPEWHTKKQKAEAFVSQFQEQPESFSEVNMPRDIKTVENTIPPKEGSLDIAPSILEEVVNLLKGKVVQGRRGLSLTSFARLHGYTYSARKEQNALRPKYEALLKRLDGEIEQQHKVWVYKGVTIQKRKRKVLQPKRKK
jgi:hypothetical protein